MTPLLKLVIRLFIFASIISASFGIYAHNTPEPKTSCQSSANFNILLLQHANTLNPAVLKTIENLLFCANKSQLLCHDYLTLIDYSLPSNQKRLWVFNLKEKKLLYHTYVAHGLNSGVRDPYFFTNTLNSKASSIGVYSTEESYYGRDGLSLKLKGLEEKFNDHAQQRSIVLHSAWYAEEDFIKKYGRAGRSWGCPAIPLSFDEGIINTIKNQTLSVIYYPSYAWLSTSKMLTCNASWFLNKMAIMKPTTFNHEKETRGEILYGETNKTNKLDANVPVITLSAKNYQRLFKSPPPLARMLRKQIHHEEYIVLNLNELYRLDTNLDKLINAQDNLAVIELFVPELINTRGYYRTEFKSANLGKPIEINLQGPDPILVTDHAKIVIKSTDKFIRWIGL